MDISKFTASHGSSSSCSDSAAVRHNIQLRIISSQIDRNAKSLEQQIFPLLSINILPSPFPVKEFAKRFNAYVLNA
eukprot:302290-Pleurochrysis_carterae.AAC.1